MNSESVLSIHARKFVGGKNHSKVIQGITYDDRGFAWATDNVQLIRVKSFGAGAIPEIRSLSGKLIDAKPIDLSHLIGGKPFICELYVKESLEDARMQLSVLKAARESTESEHAVLEVDQENGHLYLSIDVEKAKGSVYIAQDVERYIYRKIDLARFITCLEVFEGYAETVKLSTPDVNNGPLQLSAPGVDTLLVPLAVKVT